MLVSTWPRYPDDKYGPCGPVEPLAADDLAAAPIISFLPESWSPDGNHILVTAVGRQTSGCFPRVLAVGWRLACGGAYTPNSVPPDGATLRGDATTPMLLRRGRHAQRTRCRAGAHAYQ